MTRLDLSKELETRNDVQRIFMKSQFWAGFLLTSIVFLIGFFQTKLASAVNLLIPLGVGLLSLVTTLEFSDYSKLVWHESISEIFYGSSMLIIFAGMMDYIVQLIGLYGYLFLVPTVVYLGIVVKSIYDIIALWRRPQFELGK